MSFTALSALARAMFALWMLLLCLVNIGSAVLAAVKKRFFFTGIALALFAPCYLMWQVIFDIHLTMGTAQTAPLSVATGALSPWWWLLAALLLTAAAVTLLAYNIHYDKTFITSGTIKLYLDQMPCGVCCWRENGRVLFSNICMNSLCTAITGKPLLNGNQFQKAVEAGILTVEGKVWRFACRKMETEGEPLWEMVASEITAEYSKTRALEADKAELSRLNEELWDYYLSIDESVQRQEILQAKMNIHDEMNRLMLSSVAADKEDTEALDHIFSLWEQNALLLCMEADKKGNSLQSENIESLAASLGISLQWSGEAPEGLEEGQKELFFFTAQEAIINAVKHAQAKNMEIENILTEEGLICRFTNDGALPEGTIHFEGGLANLARLAEKHGATVQVEVEKKFTLLLKYHPFG